MSRLSQSNGSVNLTTEQMLEQHSNKSLKWIAEHYGVKYDTLRKRKERAKNNGSLVLNDNGVYRKANTIEVLEKRWLDEEKAHAKTKQQLKEAQEESAAKDARIAKLEAQLRSQNSSVTQSVTPVETTEVKEAVASKVEQKSTPRNTQQRYGFGQKAMLYTTEDAPDTAVKAVAPAPVAPATKEVKVKSFASVMKNLGPQKYINPKGEEKDITEGVKQYLSKLRYYKQIGANVQAQEMLDRMTTSKFALALPIAEQIMRNEVI